MATHIIPAESPDMRELSVKRAELDSLEVELAQSELELATLRGKLLAFERHYLRIVGVRQAELDEIEAQVWELLVKLRPEDSEAGEQAKQTRTQAQESSKTTQSMRDMPEERGLFEPSMDLKQTYREIAKLIHPDLATDEQERALRTVLMAEANLAYQNGDEAYLRNIMLRWKNDPNYHRRQDAGIQLAHIICRITQVNERMADICRELAELKTSEFHQLMLQVEEAAHSGIDLLAAMAGQLDRQVAEFKQRLADLVSMYTEDPI